MRTIYLDNASTTKTARQVLKKISNILEKDFGNPSSIHTLGRNAKKELEDARVAIAKELHAFPEEIIFTSGGTESNNLAIKGLAQANKEKKHLIISAIEHPSVLEIARDMQKLGYKVDFVPVNAEGIVDVDFIRSRISEETLIVSVMHVNNEIGTIQPIEEIARICKAKKVFFHTDAVQSFGKLKIDVRNISLLSASGHKINGPKGIGFLYVKKGISLVPLMQGGGQEKNLRPGTENVSGAVGMAQALSLKRPQAEIQAVRDLLIKEILKIPYSQLNGSRKKRIYNNLNISFYGIEGESLLLMLDKFGILVSTGSACSSHKLEESHVLKAINTHPLCIHGSIRISLDTLKPLSRSDVKFISSIIEKSVLKLRAMSPFKMPGDEKSFAFQKREHEKEKTKIFRKKFKFSRGYS
jgi:cysteine desulfurase